MIERQIQELIPAEYMISYISEPRLRRACPWVGVSKIATYTGKLGLMSHHEAAKAQSPEFAPPAPQPRAWGSQDGNLIRHKDKVYLELVDVEERCVEYIDEDGETIDFKELAHFPPVAMRSSRLDRLTSARFIRLLLMIIKAGPAMGIRAFSCNNPSFGIMLLQIEIESGLVIEHWGSLTLSLLRSTSTNCLKALTLKSFFNSSCSILYRT